MNATWCHQVLHLNKWKMENGNRRENFDGVERQTAKAFGACIFYGSRSILLNVLALSAMCVQQLHSNDNLNNDRKSNNNTNNNKLNGRTKKKRTVVHKAKSKTIEIDSKGKTMCGWCKKSGAARVVQQVLQKAH